MTTRRLGATAALLALLVATAAHADKIRIEKADDLPPHTYEIEGQATEYLADDARLTALASRVKADLLDDLDKYEIPDKTTLQGYYGMLGRIALLEGKYDDYRGYLAKNMELEDKEPQRLTMGLFTLSWLDAVESGADDVPAAIAASMRKRVKDLPYEKVGDVLESQKGRTEIMAQPLLEGMMDSRIQPVIDQADGTVGKDIAQTIVGMGYAVRRVLPYKDVMVDVLTEYLDAHAVEKTDIWADRDVELPAGQDVAPVLIAVWDSGVDTEIFGETCWTNVAETPGNGRDDDENGYVDDVHGIAYDLQSEKTVELLYPIGEIEMEEATIRRLSKGLSDLTSNVGSEEASELKKYMAGLSKDDVKPFIEGLGAYGGYSHGTHVAGIAVAGNPYVKLLTARMTYDHRLIPEKPTLEKARRDSTMFREVVDYFQKAGVRAVNMSWGGDIASIEAALEPHDAGGDPEARKKLAREIFEIEKAGLEKAIKSATEILFVTSAGNSNSDKEFDEFYPSSMVADNLMSVGAVDQAGDETGFTSFGKVDIYANGFEVESWVPGGVRMKYNGTSMSSPQVTGLVAKLLAVNPDLSPKELRNLIISSAEVRKSGDREYRLMHPKKALAKVMAGS